jgi:hypothetical protein
MAISVTMRSWQNPFVWVLDTNYGQTPPKMLSKNWMTFLVSWRKSDHLNPLRSTLTQLGMLRPFLLLRQMAPLALMTLVQSDDYPVAAHIIKDLFQLSPQAIAPSLASFAPGNVMLHRCVEVGKESEAKKASSG